MPEKEKKGALDAELSIGGVTLTQKLVFAKYLAVMLKSGLTISESLDIIHDQANGKFKKIVFSIMKSVQAGNSLSASLKNYPKVFSNLFVSTTYAGEASGTLEKNLGNISKQLEEENDLRRKIKSAMVYPAVVLSATFALGLAMSFLVLPKITPLFEGFDMELPITTRILISFSNIIQDHSWKLFGGVVFVIAFFVWLTRQKFIKPITHYLILRTPLIKKISRNANLASFCQTLGTLLKSGLNIDEALNISKNTSSNYYFRKSINKVSERISQGTKLSTNLQEFDEYFPKLVTSMIQVGERSGNLEDVLFYLSDFYKIEVESSTKSLATAIEPILLIGIGLAVGGMALSIVTPIYQITGNIQR